MKGINIYRLVLLLLLISALGGGVWYCYRCNTGKSKPVDGILVESVQRIVCKVELPTA